MSPVFLSLTKWVAVYIYLKIGGDMRTFRVDRNTLIRHLQEHIEAIYGIPLREHGLLSGHTYLDRLEPNQKLWGMQTASFTAGFM